MIVRMFGCDECSDCEKMLELFDAMNLSEGTKFEYIDALEENTQDLCDEHNVDLLPHVQYIDNDGKVIKELIGLKKFLKDLIEGIK